MWIIDSISGLIPPLVRILRDSIHVFLFKAVFVDRHFDILSSCVFVYIMYINLIEYMLRRDAKSRQFETQRYVVLYYRWDFFMRVSVKKTRETGLSHKLPAFCTLRAMWYKRHAWLHVMKKRPLTCECSHWRLSVVIVSVACSKRGLRAFCLFPWSLFILPRLVSCTWEQTNTVYILHTNWCC